MLRLFGTLILCDLRCTNLTGDVFTNQSTFALGNYPQTTSRLLHKPGNSLSMSTFHRRKSCMTRPSRKFAALSALVQWSFYARLINLLNQFFCLKPSAINFMVFTIIAATEQTVDIACIICDNWIYFSQFSQDTESLGHLMNSPVSRSESSQYTVPSQSWLVPPSLWKRILSRTLSCHQPSSLRYRRSCLFELDTNHLRTVLPVA